ncbi:MAG: SDR family NAD(P)-dependent oxidoreductase, partial [Acidimicrobiia bacterium]|nr:SDR family NAD(P)-dependent oxidoreductase [Acidimicrobiia bacterium]
MKRVRWERALVTGASAGIGKAMVGELARQGTALVLVARNADRLERIAGSLDVPAEVLAADLADPAQRATVASRCAAASEPIDLLVNNAGIWSFGPLAGPSGEVAEEMVARNVAAVVALSRAAAGQMVDNRRGTILNVSSIAGSQPLPYEAVYAASKAFVTCFGQGLHEELRDTGVTVTTVAPGLTRSELHARAGQQRQISRAPGWLWMEAEQVAHLALRAASRRRIVYTPGLGYRIAASLAEVMPRTVNRRMAAMINRGRAHLT